MDRDPCSVPWPECRCSLAHRIAARIGPIADGTTYFEPFLGGGSVFHLLRPSQAVLSDSASYLLHVHRAIRDNPDLLLMEMARTPFTKSSFDRVRLQGLHGLPAVVKAARVLFLLWASSKDQWRVDRRGRLLFHWGDRPGWPADMEERIMHEHEAMNQPGGWTELVWDDFAPLLTAARPGDTVFIDPPSVCTVRRIGPRVLVLWKFQIQDHLRLRDSVYRLAHSGVRTILALPIDRVSDLVWSGWDGEMMVGRDGGCPPARIVVVDPVTRVR